MVGSELLDVWEVMSCPNQLVFGWRSDLGSELQNSTLHVDP